MVVFDTSALVSAALKRDSIPEQALLRAVGLPNRLLLSQAVEHEYRARTLIGSLLSSDATGSSIS
jgi:hypothetical protein